MTRLQQGVYAHFDCLGDCQLLLSKVYEKQSKHHPQLDPTARIASVCKLVIEMAFDKTQPSEEALDMVEQAAGELVKLVEQLARDPVWPQEAALVMGGGLFKEQKFLDVVRMRLRKARLEFKTTRVISYPGDAAADLLAQELL